MTPTAGNVRGRIHGGNTETGVVPGGVRASASKMAAVVPMGKIPPPGSPGSGASCSGAAVGGAVGGGGGGGGGGAGGVAFMNGIVNPPITAIQHSISKIKIEMSSDAAVIAGVDSMGMVP